MTLVLETGQGVRDANAYALPSFVTTYLTRLNRISENGWEDADPEAQEAAIIAATSYIDTRFGASLFGTRRYSFEGVAAFGKIEVTGLATANATLTVGTTVYTFVSAANEFNENEIVIPATQTELIQNIIAAVADDAAFSAAVDDENANRIVFTAARAGDQYDDLDALIATSDGNITVVGFKNGADAGSQPLEFPRLNLFDRSGRRVDGVPRRVREATAEYAVRALAAQLYRDPTVDDRGRAVTEFSERVGPIETTTRYSEGAALDSVLKPYPAADRLLQDFVAASGRVVRG